MPNTHWPETKQRTTDVSKPGADNILEPSKSSVNFMHIITQCEINEHKRGAVCGAMVSGKVTLERVEAIFKNLW